MDVQKIRKDTARRAYNTGFMVILLPSKCGFNSMWVQGVRAEKSFQDIDFDNLVNSFEYYNCCAELGRTAAYYMDKSDYDNFINRR